MDELPDVEGAVRTWLRSVPEVTALVGQRVFFGVPKSTTDASWPLIVVRRVGGGDDLSDAPQDNALIQVDVYGSISNGNGLKAQCRAVANKVRAAFKALDNAEISDAVLYGASVESDIWLPDPDDDRPRYALTVSVSSAVVG